MTPLLLALINPAAAMEATDWKDTRWSLAVEAVLPVESLLQARNNKEFILKAYQMRAVVDCAEAEDVGKGVLVTCTFEDVAIQTIPHNNSTGERELENTLAVIEDVQDRLIGQHMEVSFNKHGKVTRVSADLPVGRNTRDRESREQIRQMVTDLAMGWTIKRPKKWEGTWYETNGPLYRVPAVNSAGGANTTTHVATAGKGRTLIQSQGSGLATAYYQPWELEGGSKVAGRPAQNTRLAGGGMSTPSGGSIGGTKFNEGTVAGGAQAVATSPQHRQWDVNLTSVAVVEDDMLVERVWNVVGAGTSSSVGAFQGVNLWYTGKLRKLGPDEQVDVGPTQVVSQPGVEVEGLEPWTPIE